MSHPLAKIYAKYDLFDSISSPKNWAAVSTERRSTSAIPISPDLAKTQKHKPDTIFRQEKNTINPNESSDSDQKTQKI
jgi:hypothetical protein